MHIIKTFLFCRALGCETFASKGNFGKDFRAKFDIFNQYSARRNLKVDHFVFMLLGTFDELIPPLWLTVKC